MLTIGLSRVLSASVISLSIISSTVLAGGGGATNCQVLCENSLWTAGTLQMGMGPGSPDDVLILVGEDYCNGLPGCNEMGIARIQKGANGVRNPNVVDEESIHGGDGKNVYISADTIVLAGEWNFSGGHGADGYACNIPLGSEFVGPGGNGGNGGSLTLVAYEVVLHSNFKFISKGGDAGDGGSACSVDVGFPCGSELGTASAGGDGGVGGNGGGLYISACSIVSLHPEGIIDAELCPGNGGDGGYGGSIFMGTISGPGDPGPGGNGGDAGKYGNGYGTSTCNPLPGVGGWGGGATNCVETVLAPDGQNGEPSEGWHTIATYVTDLVACCPTYPPYIASCPPVTAVTAPIDETISLMGSIDNFVTLPCNATDGFDRNFLARFESQSPDFWVVRVFSPFEDNFAVGLGDCVGQPKLCDLADSDGVAEIIVDRFNWFPGTCVDVRLESMNRQDFFQVCVNPYPVPANDFPTKATHVPYSWYYSIQASHFTNATKSPFLDEPPCSLPATEDIWYSYTLMPGDELFIQSSLYYEVYEDYAGTGGRSLALDHSCSDGMYAEYDGGLSPTELYVRLFPVNRLTGNPPSADHLLFELK